MNIPHRSADVEAHSLGEAAEGFRSLYKRVLSAGFWSFLLRGATRSIGLVRNVVLARLLAPEDFGLFGIVLVIISILDRFSNAGLHSAVVQKKEGVGEYLDTVWTIQALRGFALGLGLLLSAPLLASFFEEPQVVPLLQVLGVALFLSGLYNPGMLHFRRELDVKPQFIQRFGGTMVDLTVSIILAFMLRSAWALMLGLVAGGLTRIVLSYWIHPYRPRFSIDWQRAREMMGFGRWVFLNNLLFFLAYRGDNLVIGKLLGTHALGIYMLGYSIAEVVTAEIGNVLGGVAFPAYSRIQEEAERLRRAYLATIEFVASITIPCAVVLFLFAEPITSVVLGSGWMQVATILPLLAVAGSARALVLTGTAAFYAVGRPLLSFWMNLVGVGVTYALMFPLIASMGLQGVALAVAVGQVSQFVPLLLSVRRSLGIGLGEVGRRLIPGALLGCAMGGVLGVVNTLSMPGPLHLALGLGSASLVYLICAWILWKTASNGPMSAIKQFWIHFRSPAPISTQSTAVSACT